MTVHSGTDTIGTSRMLSYDEELELSDYLVERRKVKDLLKAQGLTEPSTAQQQEIIAAGDRAAKRLVVAYLPLCRSIAYGVYQHSDAYRRGLGLEVEDLINTGIETMLRACDAFNARGSSEHPGVRFATYAQPWIRKEMLRMVAKHSTQYYASIDTIQATWAFLAKKSQLTEKLGRDPYISEIEEESGISHSAILPGLPARISFLSADELEVADRSEIEREAQELADAESVNGMLEYVLRQYISDALVDVLVASLGIDSGYPRSTAEIAKHLGISTIKAGRIEAFIYDVIRHPAFRIKLVREINSVNDTL